MEGAANFLGDFNSPTEFTDFTELPCTKTIHENLWSIHENFCSPNNEQSELPLCIPWVLWEKIVIRGAAKELSRRES